MSHLDVDALRRSGAPLPDRPADRLVPEPVAKDALRSLGVVVPRGVTGTGPADLATVAARLRSPLVLKAWGAGIVHKSDLGAVRLGLGPDDLSAAATEMRDRLVRAGCAPDGFLVEEQAPAGVELILGVVRDPSFGPLILLGLGGVLAEILDDVVAELAPVSEADARAMVRGFRGAALLQGARGAQPLDEDAIVALVLAIGGAGGLVEQLGGSLLELDCNPVIIGASGPVVADARLIVGPEPTPVAARPDATDFTPLFRPRTVGVVGASTKGGGFGNRALAAYRAFGWTDGLYAVHPKASEIDGVPAIPSPGAVDGGIDYLLVAVPAHAAIDLVAASGPDVGIVHVISGGFGEAGPEGGGLEVDLLEAARDAGVRVVGPNSMGVYCPAGRQTFVLDVPAESGPVGFVSQSGGIAGDVIRLGAKRGLRFSKVVSIGNAVDVTPAEMVQHLVDDPDTRVIGVYLEGTRDGARLIDALAAARGRTPVVVLAGGLSVQGSHAVSSHTGNLAGDRRLWEAISARTGATVVATIEDLIGALVVHQRYPESRPVNGGTLVLGVGGGASVLAMDVCDRAGIQAPPIAPELEVVLREHGYGVGMSVANPIEISAGPAAPTDVFNRVLDAVLPAQPFTDVLLHLNVASYYGYGSTGLTTMFQLLEQIAAARYAARLVLAARNLDTGVGAEVDALAAVSVATGVPMFRTFDEATRAIASAQRFDTKQTLD